MITVSDLVYRYDTTTVLDHLSVQIPDAECLLVVGPNGSGKTTLVRHFNGLLTPDAGTVTVDDRSVTESPVYARTHVGMVFQHPRDQFVATTVGADVAFGPENLGLSRDRIDSRVQLALSAVGLDGYTDARVDELSGGEQARVAIAGALAMDPSHLVLDEPLTGLDWPAQQAVVEQLRDLAASGTSIIIVTHDLRHVQTLADRVIVLSDGHIVSDGSVESVTEDLPTYGVKPPTEC